MKTIFRFLLVLALAGASLTAHANVLPKPEPGLHVSVVLFSGRPDPKFVITDPREIAEILAAVRGFPRHASLDSTSALPHPMFGFRGVIIQNFSAQSPELGFLHVYGNDVEMLERLSPSLTVLPLRSFRFDAGGSLQQRLMNMAQARGVIPWR